MTPKELESELVEVWEALNKMADLITKLVDRIEALER